MTTCKRCNKPLKDVEEIHACGGELYCSKDCTVLSLTDEIILNAKEMAIEKYHEEAEIVLAEDIICDEIYMSRDQIMEALKRLAKAQGMYSRLLNWMLSADKESVDAMLTDLENAKPKNTVDLVMYLEGC